jgi:D-3-phosphoglycerate dehydrogenase
MHKVLITDARHASIAEEKAVLEAAGVTVDATFSETEDDVIKNGQGAMGFLVSFAPITRRVMEALPELKIVVRYGVGYDNVDVAAATDLGKYVANVPDYCIEEVASGALSLAMSGLRMTHFFGSAVEQHQWIIDPTPEALERPSTLKAGIVGLGRIGRQFARYMENIVPHIFYYDPYLSDEIVNSVPYTRLHDLAELFATCQIISLHTPLNDETRGFIGHNVLSHASKLILINTSRGGVTDKQAIVQAIDAGHVKFFGADVYWEEPPNFQDPWNVAFLQRKNVLVTPHMSWYSQATEKELRRKAAKEVLRVIQGKQPLNPVNG